MFAYLRPRRGLIGMVGALALGISCTALASLQSYPAEMREIVSSRLEVRFQDAAGNVIDGGALKVYDAKGNLVDRALPQADGSYVLSSDSRGKLRFTFENQTALKGFDVSARSPQELSGFIAGVIDPKVDYYASKAGITPRVRWTVGDDRFVADFEMPVAPADGDTLARPKALSNQTCATALAVGIVSTTNDVLAAGAGDGNCGSFVTGRGTWYSFVGNGDVVTASTVGSPSCGFWCPDTILSVYTGTCGSLTCLAGNDDAFLGANPFESQVRFCSQPGVTYYVEVEPWSSFDWNRAFTLTLSTTPAQLNAGISCEGAQDLSVPGSVIGNTLCTDGTATGMPECNLPYGPALTGNNGAYYQITGTGDPITVSTSNDDTQFDTQIRVYCTNCGDAGGPSCVASDDDSGGAGDPFSSELTFCSQPGAEYVVLITGWGDAAGQFELTTTSTPVDAVNPNDLCSPTGPNTGDGRANGFACNPVGAVCIKCLDDANCFDDMDPSTADRIGGQYKGDGSTCIEMQGPPPTTYSRSPMLPISAVGPNAVFDQIVIPAGTGTIGHLALHMDIQHTWIGDLRITLTHVESGLSSTLWAYPNGCGPTDDIRVIWDDDYPELFFCADAQSGDRYGVITFPGWGPDLTQWEGLDPAGTWQLTVIDNEAFDGGVFRTWALEIDNRTPVRTCGKANNGLGNGVDPQPGHSRNCNDCPGNTRHE